MLNLHLQKIIILVILYLGFISLGLPDQILGVAWPSMRGHFVRSLDSAGILLFFTAILSALSSFCSGYFIRRYSIPSILITSCFLTILGLAGYGLSQTWLILVICTIPLGIGAGAIDAALNDYVAKNYASRHMNWLHACWGIGAATGPAIMTYAVVSQSNWRWGYLAIAAIQFCLLSSFVLTLPFWKKVKPSIETKLQFDSPKLISTVPILSMLMFFCYTCAEVSISVWFYSLLVEQRSVSAKVAGTWIVLYWSFLTIGRFSIGLFSNRLGNRKIIYYGILGAIFCLSLLIFQHDMLTMLALCGLGFSFAGIYPSMMHETPKRVGNKLAATLTGYQAGMGALGVALLAPLVGIIIGNTNLNFLIPILLIILTTMLVMDKILDAKSR